MPELPDVEIFRARFEKLALGRTISEVKVLDERLLEGVTPQRLARALTGHRFVAAKRHGKHLLAELDDGALLALHFGMTGEIAAFAAGQPTPRYTALQLEFDDGSAIAVTSRRRLGHIGLAGSADDFIASKALGPDALEPELGLKAFEAALGSKRGTIKSALMNQGRIAGIGNIYSDEILFRAGLDPRLRVGELRAADVEHLHGVMREVLQEAIAGGFLSEGDRGGLPANWLLAHREKGARCPCCGKPLKRAKLGGRTAYFCSTCQARR